VWSAVAETSDHTDKLVAELPSPVAASKSRALAPRPDVKDSRVATLTSVPGSADEAMARYAAGDDDAFAAVYDRVAPRLAAYLQRRVHDRGRVEDLIQQTFLHMHRARGTFIQGAEVLPWAFAIARRLFLNRRRDERELPLDDEGDAALIDHAYHGEELLAAHETAGRLRAALEGLSEPQRAAIELVKGEGMSLAQAARILGTTVLGVKLRSHRAYVALRAAARDPEPRAPFPPTLSAAARKTKETL
jgi:RNA polymerase sigma-70 factor (ECF subfamily)